ncbi:putative flavin-containing monooxygenase 1 [Bienertia sinuspersici]
MAPITSKIAIIGAGISGIAAAKQLAKYEPMVFEASDSIGGVWKHASYNSTKLQTPRCDYEFSDFPWPNRDDTSFPSHDEIVQYLHSYATHFDVLKFVKFNSKVVGLRYLGDHHRGGGGGGGDGEFGRLLTGHPSWEVAVQTNDDFDSIQRYTFELVVVCIGKYGDIPKIPNFPPKKGPEMFKGKVLHTLDYCKLSKEEASQLLRGKSVAIVGYKKSAIDLAVECAQANHGMSTINPMIPNMAFIGYIETVSNLQTAELRCKWLAKLVDDQFKLPSVSKMLGHIEKEVDVMKRTTRFYKRQCISTYIINHNDELCEEMGWSSWRKKSWFSEAFSPYTSQDYGDDN